MTDNSVFEFGTEPAEVDAVLEALVGERDPGEDSFAWYLHLSSRQALLLKAAERLKQQRADTAYEIYQELGETRSYAKLAAILGRSRALAQQLVEQARA